MASWTRRLWSCTGGETTGSAPGAGPLVRRALPLLVLIVLPLLAYLPALGGQLVWDDRSYLGLPVLDQGWSGLGRIWGDMFSLPQLYPLTFTSYWVERQLWGELPFGHHLGNVVLHALVGLLLWRVLRDLAVSGAW